jgi:hypothetical protein
VEHVVIEAGDTVLGDVLAPGEVDIYEFQAPAGSVATLDVRNAPPAGWRPNLGIWTGGFERNFALYGVTATKIQTEVLTASGTYKMLLGAGDTTGGYRVRLTIAPGRIFTASGVGNTTPGRLQFGAAADSELTLALKWRGPSPVTLATFEGPAGPVTSSQPVVTRAKSSTQGGFIASALGDYVATFDVPAGTQSWSATARVKPPSPARGVVHDVRTEGVPAARTVSVLNASDAVVATIVGERGGPNDLLLRPTGFHVNGLVADPRNGGCGALGLEPAGAPLAYRFRCLAGWYAEIGDVVREGGLVTSFAAPVVRSPNGSGSTRFDAITYDAQARPVSWTETRSFDASGNVHILQVADVTRRSDGVVVSYELTHKLRRGQDEVVLGVHGYAPFRTR